MNTATIFKEEINNPAIWDTIIRDLELPKDTDEIIVKAVSHATETQRKQSAINSLKQIVRTYESKRKYNNDGDAVNMYKIAKQALKRR